MQQKVIEAMAKHLGISPQDIDPNSSLSDDLELGPVELSDLLAALAAEFTVTFEPEDVEGMHTVNDLVETIEDLSLE
jgi:acyl carrier protein